MKSPTRYKLKALAWHVPLSVYDRFTNLRFAQGSPRILITRHSGKREYVFRDFLSWIRFKVPELGSRMEFHRLPCQIRDWSRFSLHVSWVGDTVDMWSPSSFRRAMALQSECQRRGLGVINDISRLSNTSKSLGAQLMRAPGLRTPRHVAITDPVYFRKDHAGLDFPLLIRENRGHGQAAILVEQPDRLAAVDLSQFKSPIAVEFIDTSSESDGLFRKYRYIAAGEIGVPRHLIANDSWEVRPHRRLTNAKLRDEEFEYVNAPDPNHEVLQAARRALGLDVVGFDYSYDREGCIVVWEANPFLNLNYPAQAKASHINLSVRRSFAVVAWLYCVRAEIRVPESIMSMLDQSVSGLGQRAAA